MDVYQPERRHPKGQARERYAARQRKEMVRRSSDPAEPELVAEKPVMSRAPYDPGRVNSEVLKGRALVLTRDTLWYVQHKPIILISIIVLIVAIIGVFLGTHILGGRVFPNVWALNTNLGEMSVEEAASVLQNKWTNATHIQLRDGDRIWSATPAEMGLSLDAV